MNFKLTFKFKIKNIFNIKQYFIILIKLLGSSSNSKYVTS